MIGNFVTSFAACRRGRRKSCAVFAAAFVLAAFVLFVCVSCSDDGGGAGGEFSISDFGGVRALTGVWDGEYAGEVYTIDTAQGTFDSSGAYAGNSMAVVKDGENSGRIVMRYTRALIPNAQGAPYYSTDANKAPDVGKWYAVFFRVIDENTIALSGGWKSGGPNSFGTMEECRAAMTQEAGYFGMVSECRRR